MKLIKMEVSGKSTFDLGEMIGQDLGAIALWASINA
jgi:hypothetical protein